jgi:hypothetical protein
MRPSFIFFYLYFEKMRSLVGFRAWGIGLWNGGVRGGNGVLGFGGNPSVSPLYTKSFESRAWDWGQFYPFGVIKQYAWILDLFSKSCDITLRL